MVSYSALRSGWFVFAGEGDSKRFYLRFNSNPSAVAGFLIAYDKTLPSPEASSLSAVISMMSLAIQPFANPKDPKQLPNLSQSAIATLAALVQSPAASAASDQTSNGAAPPPAVPAPVAPAVTPPAGGATSSDSDALAAAQRRIAELESAQANARSQVGINASKVRSRQSDEPNSQQMFLDIAVAVAVGLFLISAYLAVQLKTRSSGFRIQPSEPLSPHHTMANRVVPTAPSAPVTPESGQQNISIAPSQLATGINSAFAHYIPPSIFNVAATRVIGACVVLAVAIISRVFGL